MRNFFHNISDIVLAIIIVVLASGIIFWRMQVIMDYPDKVAAEQAARQAKIEQQQAEEQAKAEAEAAAKAAAEAAAQAAAEAEAAAADGQTTEEPQG